MQKIFGQFKKRLYLCIVKLRKKGHKMKKKQYPICHATEKSKERIIVSGFLTIISVILMLVCMIDRDGVSVMLCGIPFFMDCEHTMRRKFWRLFKQFAKEQEYIID